MLAEVVLILNQSGYFISNSAIMCVLNKKTVEE